MRAPVDCPQAEGSVPRFLPSRGAARRRVVRAGAGGGPRALPTRRRPARAVESAPAPPAVAAGKILEIAAGLWTIGPRPHSYPYGDSHGPGLGRLGGPPASCRRGRRGGPGCPLGTPPRPVAADDPPPAR